MLKTVGSILLIFVALFSFFLSSPAHAYDLAQGNNVFTANCAQCHMRGLNVVVRDKTLQKEALEKYGMYSQEAIVSQAMKGKNAMPAFGRRLSQEQLENVAAYILDQADSGWAG
ncbi:MAG: c-type cytochrome [Synechococcaceae cyanobacterium SM2_3_1]|nr:c-type cytochrome [Synechococcaceae cyanobacterium SM2_3_1]